VVEKVRVRHVRTSTAYRRFALRLSQAASIATRLPANFAPKQSVVQATLPDNIVVDGLSDGFLVFDFSKNPAYCGGPLPAGVQFADRKYQKATERRNNLAQKRAKYMNAFVATLYAGGQDAGHGFLPQPPVHIGNYLFGDKVGSRWELTGPCPFGGDRCIPADAICKASEYMNAIFDAYGDDAIELLSLLHGATSHYANHEFSSCLVIGWSVVENLQNRLWREYIDQAALENGGFTEISRDRLKQLNGRDFSASVVSQLLSLARTIDDGRLKQMNTARKARNDFAHYLKPVSHNVAFVPVSLAAAIIGIRQAALFAWAAALAGITDAPLPA
jgi:hypothetical protein